MGRQTTWRRGFSVMLDKGAILEIGPNCFFNKDCSINCNLNVIIGEGCLFGENVKIYDHNHRFANKKLSIKEQGFSNGKVRIGNRCWIGSNVTILKGTDIKDNCVIGAGCVVNGVVDEGTILKTKPFYTCEKIRGESDAKSHCYNGSL